MKSGKSDRMAAQEAAYRAKQQEILHHYKEKKPSQTLVAETEKFLEKAAEKEARDRALEERINTHPDMIVLKSEQEKAQAIIRKQEEILGYLASSEKNFRNEIVNQFNEEFPTEMDLPAEAAQLKEKYRSQGLYLPSEVAVHTLPEYKWDNSHWGDDIGMTHTGNVVFHTGTIPYDPAIHNKKKSKR